MNSSFSFLRAVRLCLAGLALVVVAHAQSLSGTYSGSETAVLTLTALGQTDTETLRGSSTVVMTHVGNSLSYTVTDPYSGVSASRTLTLSGSSIVAMSGPAIFFRSGVPGFSTSQNQITSVSGTATPGRIELTMRGRVVGVIDGTAFTMDVVSNASFTNSSLQPAPPAISLSPQSRSVNAGGSVTFSVSATGTAPLTYQWQRNGAPIPGATQSTYTLSNVQPSDAGAYSVVVTNAQGSTTSGVATLTVVTGTAPLFAIQPLSQSAVAGGAVTFNAAIASGTTPITLQWRRNGVAIAGATGTSLTRTNLTPADSGAYDVVATNAFGSTASAAAFLTVPITGPANSRLANLSVRSNAGTAERTLIAGFVIGGSGSKQVLLRGIGPGLAQFGLGGVLADPQLRVFATSGAIVGENNDWGGTAALSAAFARTGAFGLSATSRDAALLLNVAAGGYSGHLLATSGSGTGLIEAYDADTTTSTARFINLSARNQVGTGADILIAGFVVTGTTAKQVLIRGIGPTLSAFGVSGVLENPRVQVYSGPTLIADNDDWGGFAPLANAFTAVGAFGLPGTSRDAAVLLTLLPGNYTAQVSGVGATTGVALVEVYEMP